MIAKINLIIKLFDSIIIYFETWCQCFSRNTKWQQLTNFEGYHSQSKSSSKYLQDCRVQSRAQLFKYGAVKHTSVLNYSGMKYNFNDFWPWPTENIRHTWKYERKVSPHLKFWAQRIKFLPILKILNPAALLIKNTLTGTFFNLGRVIEAWLLNFFDLGRKMLQNQQFCLIILPSTRSNPHF